VQLAPKFFAASPYWLAAIFFIGDFASPNPNAKAPALWTHHQCGFCRFQYCRQIRTQTILDESETMKYNPIMPAMINRILRPTS